MEKPRYSIETKNGMVRVLVDDLLFFEYEQLAYNGRYFYKDFTNVYGLDIYMKEGKTIEIYFKTKETWLAINKLMVEFL